MREFEYNEESPSERPRRQKRPLTLKSRAIRYLAQREYSRKELRQKLLRAQGDEPNERAVDELLDELEKRNYLSDERFAGTRARVRSSKFGNARIAYELKMQGVSAEHIAQALSPLKETEFERAQALWVRRFGSAPKDFKERAKQIRYLSARGFSMDVIRRVIESAGADIEDSFNFE